MKYRSINNDRTTATALFHCHDCLAGRGYRVSLRSAGIPEHQLDAVLEIAHHIRDEAAHAAFDEQAAEAKAIVAAPGESCSCTPTASGQSCC